MTGPGDGLGLQRLVHDSLEPVRISGFDGSRINASNLSTWTARIPCGWEPMTVSTGLPAIASITSGKSDGLSGRHRHRNLRGSRGQPVDRNERWTGLPARSESRPIFKSRRLGEHRSRRRHCAEKRRCPPLGLHVSRFDSRRQSQVATVRRGAAGTTGGRSSGGPCRTALDGYRRWSVHLRKWKIQANPNAGWKQYGFSFLDRGRHCARHLAHHVCQFETPDPYSQRACARSILHIASACRALHRSGSPRRYLARLSGRQHGPVRGWEAQRREGSHHGAEVRHPDFGGSEWLRARVFAFRADRNHRREAPHPFFAERPTLR